MIGLDLMAILRCPLSPSQTKLLHEGNQLKCERCALCFKIEDGFPRLVVEEAILPEGCESLDDLPCKIKVSRRGAETQRNAEF